MNKQTKLGRLVLFLVFILPLLLFAFLYVGTKPVFEGVPYQYHTIEGGDTVFHELSTFGFRESGGEMLRREDLQGKIVIIDFFSTRDSAKVTTVLHGNLKRTYENVNWETDPPYLFLSINMGDSLADLQAYVEEMEIDSRHWKMVQGSQEEIYRLATQALMIPDFVRHRPGNPPFTAQTVAMVDKDGLVRDYFVATNLSEERKMQENLIALLRLEYPEDLKRIRQAK